MTALRITVEDLETGHVEEAEIPEGEYFLICADPCHLAGAQRYGNGTHVLTIKGRTA